VVAITALVVAHHRWVRRARAATVGIAGGSIVATTMSCHWPRKASSVPGRGSWPEPSTMSCDAWATVPLASMAQAAAASDPNTATTGMVWSRPGRVDSSVSDIGRAQLEF
jgi:hypothetical protein